MIVWTIFYFSMISYRKTPPHFMHSINILLSLHISKYDSVGAWKVSSKICRFFVASSHCELLAFLLLWIYYFIWKVQRFNNKTKSDQKPQERIMMKWLICVGVKNNNSVRHNYHFFVNNEKLSPAPANKCLTEQKRIRYSYFMWHNETKRSYALKQQSMKDENFEWKAFE